MPKRLFSGELPPELGIDDARTLALFHYSAHTVHPNSQKKVAAICPWCSFEYTRQRHRITERCPRCVHRKAPWPDLSQIIDNEETHKRFYYTEVSIHPASMQKVVYRCTG